MGASKNKFYTAQLNLMNCYGMLKTNFQPQAAEIYDLASQNLRRFIYVFLANYCA
jgi:hypothetical protein